MEQVAVTLDALVHDSSQTVDRATSSEMKELVDCGSCLPCAFHQELFSHMIDARLPPWGPLRPLELARTLP
eukprot:7112724-Pyramimonas_sp.AAC.1